MNSRDIHAVMASKGFWSPDVNRVTYMRAKTYMQLLHILDEAQEAVMAFDEDEYLEENADVIIVAMDLLGAHGLDVDLADIQPQFFGSVEELVVAAYRIYRKTGAFPTDRVIEVIASVMSYIPIDMLVKAVEAKMKRNAERPALYGVTPSQE